jgi:ATP-dependent Clp protease ATP-binding subunit ClpA
VLLLDEIEKAHPDVYNILLQVMDHGKLTDHNGRAVDFRNVILIMTSNAGAADMAREADRLRPRPREGEDTAAIERMFTPEFRNRLDATISFAPLARRSSCRWSRSSSSSSRRSSWTATSTSSSRPRPRPGSATRATTTDGRPPPGRVIQEHLKKPLAEELLFGKLTKGGVVRVGVKGDKLDLRYEAASEPKLLAGAKPPLLTAD